MIGLAVALVGSLALTTLLYLFVLLPLSNAEESIGLTDEALVGRVGRLTVPIPEGGYGEVLIETVTGSLLKTAQSLDGTSISTDHRVVIIEVKGNIAIVMPYDEPTIREEI
jgi:membrane protein implicated in regulation of membrane protease activity